MLWGIIAVVVLFLLALWVMVTYNSLIRARLQSENAWSQIDVQLKRRYDLIPNLVETVKGYAAHERQTLENVIKARQQAIAAGNVRDQAAAENMLTGALRQLFAVAENYPDLKANQNFLALQEELASTENKIGFARQFYNDTVSRYNALLQVFPNNLLANSFAFTPREFFEVQAAEERNVPKVQF